MTETTQKARETKAWYAQVWDALTGAHPSITDIAQRRTAQLLAGLALSIGLIDLLGIVATPKRFSDPNEAGTLILLSALAVIMLVVYGLCRTRYFTIGIYLTMASISGLVFLSPVIGEKDPVGFALSVLPLSFILAFGILPFRGIITLTIINTLVPLLLPLFIPTISADYQWTVSGVSLALGVLLITVYATGRSIENVRLTELKQVNKELQNLSATLEARVTDRTKDMLLAAEVGRRVSTMHNRETMLGEAVDLIGNRFDLYYTQIYLLDEQGRNLVLRAGTGEIGQELLLRSHRLSMGQTSINVAAAVGRKAVVVEDTNDSILFLPHPLLAETRSEMSVPLVAGDRVLGVLDLQSREPGKLTQDNLPVFDTLAGQLAAALVTAQLFEQVEKTLSEVELHGRESVRQGWDEFLNAVDSKERIGYVYDQGTVAALDEPIVETPANPCVIAAPINFSGEQVGVLQLAADHLWSASDQQLVSQVATQVAQQVENLRLLGQAERYRAEAEEAVRRLTREDWDEYLKTTKTADLAFKYAENQVQPLVEVENNSNGALHMQIKVRDEEIGEFAFPAMQDLAPEDADLVSAIGEQLGAHLENLRLYSTAQQEVEERRRAESIVAKRADQLATVARLSTLVSTIQSPEEMLQTVVDLTKANFDLYHAHIYLLDEASHVLTLTRGAGEIGRQMVAEGRRIPMDMEKSLVARAARTRQGLIVNNVSEDPDFLPHPLLPNTCSEMAVPLIAGDTLLGVLDVQADTRDRFTEEDIQIKTTLASQVAVALENARQYAQTQESERLVRTVIDSTPDWIFIKDDQHRYRLVNQGYANSLHIKLEDFMGKTDLDLGFPEDYVKGNPEMGIRGFWADDRAVMEGGEAILFPNDPSMIDGVLHVFNTLKTPLRDQNGNIWGVLAFARDVTEREQMLNQTNRLYTASRRLSEAQDLNEILATVVETLGITDFNRSVLFFFETDKQGELIGMNVGANWYSGHGPQPFPPGTRFTSGPLWDLFRNMRTREPIFMEATNDFAQKDGVMSGASLPLWIGDRQIGVLALQSDVQHTFTEDEKRPAISLAQQAAIVIQNRLLLEQSIKAAESLSRSQETARMGTWTVDLSTQMITLSREAMVLLDLEPDPNGLAMSMMQFAQMYMAPEDIGVITEHLQYAIEHQNEPDYQDTMEYSVISSRGKRLILSASIRRKEGPDPIVIGTTQDITERKLAEVEIEGQRRTLSEVMAAAKMANWEFDVASGCFTFNEGYYALLGTSLEEQGTYTMPAPVFSERFVHPEDAKDTGMRIGAALAATDPSYQAEFEARLIHKDGTYHTVLVTLQVGKDAQGQTVRLFGANQDITERKQAEAEIESQQRTLQAVLDNMPAGIFMVEAPSGRPILSNRKAEEFLGRGISPNAVGEDLNQVYQAYKYGTEELYPAEEMPIVAGLSGATKSIDDMEVVRPDGSRLLLQVVGSPIFDVNGKVTASVVLFSDITELRKANDEIRRTEQMYRQLLDSIPDFVLVKGPKSHIVWANKAFREYYGMTNEQLKDLVDSPVVEPDYTQKYVQDDEYVFNSGKVLFIPEEPIIRYDGEVRPVQTAKAPIFDENGQVIMTVGVMRDITEAKKTQEMLAKRAVELATVAEISTRVSTIQQPDEMLQTVVDLTQQTFNLYHAHIYLMDESVGKLLLAKGSGETGRKMVAEGRTIESNSEKSLVARAARTRQGVIVNNVHEDPDFLPHPLLPDTQSEMAVPMVAGDRLLGVMDVQDMQVGRFTPEDINILTTLAAQVAIALQNARSYARAQRQAEREALINAISERIQATNSVESALQVAVREIGRALGAPHTAIRLGLERKKENE